MTIVRYKQGRSSELAKRAEQLRSERIRGAATDALKGVRKLGSTDAPRQPVESTAPPCMVVQWHPPAPDKRIRWARSTFTRRPYHGLIDRPEPVQVSKARPAVSAGRPGASVETDTTRARAAHANRKRKRK